VTPPRRNAERQLAATPAAAPLAASSPSSNLPLLILAIAIAVALMAAATALIPASGLPAAVFSVVHGRRELIVLYGIAITLSIGVGLVIAQVLK
jgi:hypothetical protein